MLAAPAHGARHTLAPPEAREPTTHAEGRRHRLSPATAARAPPVRHPKVRSDPAPTGLSGPGAGLSAAERGRFEPLLGLDLGAVRVHSGAAAETLAHEHRAHAFTYGNHVVLGRNTQHAARRLAREFLRMSSCTSGSRRPPRRLESTTPSARARAPRRAALGRRRHVDPSDLGVERREHRP